MAKKPEKAQRRKQFYGRAEWYGELFTSMPQARRVALLAPAAPVPCPFFHQVPSLGPKSGNLNCNKIGGVCSLRNFHEPQGSEDLTFGPITATCPNRFLEHGTIIEHIGKVLLGTDQPLFAKELPFLRRPKSPVASESIAETEEEEAAAEIVDEEGVDAAKEDVGRIDLVFVHPDNPDEWCAVEMQAVYFSGGAMSKDTTIIRNHGGNGVPFPGAARRPDFRSSGPKRLMPQLMIKIPTLRRWGKKMVVVIDRPFLDAMDQMERVEHISNSDIVWVIVRFDETVEPGKATLVIDDTIFTTLEDAVKGLTAGQPTTLPEFEDKLSKKVGTALPPKAV